MPPQAASQENTKTKRKWWALIAVCFGLFMALLDVTIVNVALPAIQSDLNTDFSSLEWVISAYTLIFAVALVTASRLGDIYGRKTIFIIGLGIFTIGSLLCALSAHFTYGSLSHIQTLNVSRGVQGLGASAMMPLSLAIISDTFTGKQRGLAFGIWGGISGFATAIGPLVGGYLVDYVNWQSIFFLNIPIGIIGILLSIWAINQSRDESAHRHIDMTGLILFTGFMFCLIFGLIRVNQANLSWTSTQILGLLGGAVVLLIIFILVELRMENPMIDPRLFKIPSFTGAAIAGFTLSAGMYALLFYLSLYLQNSLGFEASEAGFRLVIFSAISFLLSPVAGILMSKGQPKWLVFISLAFLAVGVWTMSGISPGDKPGDWLVLVPGFILAGIGNGLINPPISNLAVGTVEPRRSGMASGVNSVCRQIGIAFGTAFFGAILANRYTAIVKEKINGLHVRGLSDTIKEKMTHGISEAGPIAGSTGLKGNGASSGAADGFTHSPLFPKIQEISHGAFISGTSDIIKIAAIILAIGAVASLFLIRKKDMKH
ncbi:MFS transporter [Aciduricibacillus chroicocephali]|uniref:MFS transporter n=1 Tax=Aciduricibacillus chroicocephali TaxID=3054939 RepID=A0ABY9KY42_9BACI|nr:MFS transporter [Bacillaceae bacterium 44XB]